MVAISDYPTKLQFSLRYSAHWSTVMLVFTQLTSIARQENLSTAVCYWASFLYWWVHITSKVERSQWFTI